MNKKLKSYLNENGLRFNLNEQRIWKYIEETFGENRARELSDIFDETYIDKGKAIDVSRKYQFCNSFEEATTLMYFQSNWFLKNSNIILDDILKSEPKSILELGCYTGIFSNYLTKTLENSNITGVDIEDNLINFGKDKFNNEKLNLICIDYKELKKLNKHTPGGHHVKHMINILEGNYKINLNEKSNSDDIDLTPISKFIKQLKN